jgi:hypothetical protein
MSTKFKGTVEPKVHYDEAKEKTIPSGKRAKRHDKDDAVDNFVHMMRVANGKDKPEEDSIKRTKAKAKKENAVIYDGKRFREDVGEYMGSHLLVDPKVGQGKVDQRVTEANSKMSRKRIIDDVKHQEEMYGPYDENNPDDVEALKHAWGINTDLAKKCIMAAHGEMDEDVFNNNDTAIHSGPKFKITVR